MNRFAVFILVANFFVTSTISAMDGEDFLAIEESLDREFNLRDVKALFVGYEDFLQNFIESFWRDPNDKIPDLVKRMERLGRISEWAFSREEYDAAQKICNLIDLMMQAVDVAHNDCSSDALDAATLAYVKNAQLMSFFNVKKKYRQRKCRNNEEPCT